MKKILFLSFVFISVISQHRAFAQQTGDFYIGFPSPDTLLTEDSVHLHFHVPVSYQPGNPAKLIVAIHGLGNPQTPEQIRNYFSPAADSIYAIVVAPKPYIGQPLTVNHPLSQVVINIAIDSVLQWYNIDTNEVYIAGYSAGSDVASRYVIEDGTHTMKGLIWYAPGFFSKPNLSDFTTFPITCLCYGDRDPLSNLINQVTSIRDSFAQQPQFDFFYNEIPGIDHTMEFYHFTVEMLECFRFFNDPENFIADSSYVGENFLSSADLSFYPNPSAGKVFFKGNLLSEIKNLRVMDLSGKIILEVDDIQESRTIDLTGYAAGTYIMNLQIGGKSYHRRFVLLDK